MRTSDLLKDNLDLEKHRLTALEIYSLNKIIFIHKDKSWDLIHMKNKLIEENEKKEIALPVS